LENEGVPQVANYPERRKSMSDNSENIFAKRDQEHAEKRQQWGLGDLSAVAWAQVWFETWRRIGNENITDEAEQRKIADEVKAQYKAHEAGKATLAKSSSAPLDEVEYRRGYERCIQYNKEEEEKGESPYRKGWNAASEELRLKRAAEMDKKDLLPSGFPDDFLENNAITQLREEVKALDERLKKLERYTEE
jgi:hypothetical protein